MATPETQGTVVASDGPMSVHQAAAAFPGDMNDELLDLAGNEPGMEEGEQPLEEAPIEEELEAEAPEADNVEGEQADNDDEAEIEPEVAIDIPASWKQDHEEIWSQLGPEMQAIVAEQESGREKTLHRSMEEAATHRKAAEKAAEKEYNLTQTYAQQLETIANARMPQEPDPMLIASNPEAYAQQMAYYKHSQAEHQQLMQHVQGLRQQAENDFTQQRQEWVKEQNSILADKVEGWTDDTKRAELLTSLTNVGTELGYDPELMAEAGASDILALQKAQKWKDGYDKYQAAVAKQMSKARPAKITNKPGAAQPKGTAKARNRKAANQRLRETGSLRDAAAALPPMPR